MLNLPPKFILYDSEFTAWEGSRERNWAGPNEHREIIQMGAIKVDNADLREIDVFMKFIQPKINPTISEYLTTLTGITNAILSKHGVDLPTATSLFKEWCAELPIYSFGRDSNVLQRNCDLLHIENPFNVAQFHNIREFFNANGVPTEDYYSSTIVEAFGEEPKRLGHDAVNDARSILDALILLDRQLHR